ncbi:S8 family serine peptidase [Streptomyces sp. NPDC000880]
MPRLRPRIRPVLTGWLSLSLVCTAAAVPVVLPPGAVAAEAGARQADPVKLPVIPSVLDDGAPCTAGASKVATAAPPQQRTLALSRAWQFSRGGGVKVAVVDSGVAGRASGLAGRVVPVSGTGDCVGHGSFVASLVASAPSSGTGFTGVAPKARILAVRGTDERGVPSAATVAAGVRAAADAGARVIVVAPALATGSPGLTKAVEHAIDRDALVVAAAAPESDTRKESAARDYWPAAMDGVLSVLGVAEDGTVPGSTAAPRQADLAAPGSGVIGAGPRGKGHFIGTGSSLAAGFVAGAAALVRDRHPELSAAQTAERLVTTAYPADVPRLDIYAALTATGQSGLVAADSAPKPAHLPSDAVAANATRRASLLGGAGAATVLVVVWAALAVRARSRRTGATPA